MVVLSGEIRKLFERVRRIGLRAGLEWYGVTGGGDMSSGPDCGAVVHKFAGADQVGGHVAYLVEPGTDGVGRLADSATKRPSAELYEPRSSAVYRLADRCA